MNPLAILSSASVLILLSLTSAFSASHTPPKVITTIKPLHSLTSSIMEGVGKVDLLIEGNSSPHTFSLTPSKTQSLQDSDVIIWVGEGLEAALEKPIQSIGKNATIIELLDEPGVTKLKFAEEHVSHEVKDEKHDEHDGDEESEQHAEGHHHHGSLDPHIWLDPENAINIAKVISEKLQAVDPANKLAYSNNFANLKTRLSQLQNATAAKLGSFKKKKYVLFHDAFGYFENRFGISRTDVITHNPGNQPGAKTVKSIITSIKENQVSCLFSEPQFNPKTLNLIAKEANITTGVLDPLGAGLKNGPDLYFELINQISDSLAGCGNTN